MALVERVAALLAVDLVEVMGRVDDPEGMLRQVIRDAENQLIQVKTQWLLELADKQALINEQKSAVDDGRSWHERAGLAVSASKEEMARAALMRALACEEKAQLMVKPVAEKSEDVEGLRSLYERLDGRRKLAGQYLVLLEAQMRRARAAGWMLTAREAVEAMTLVTESARLAAPDASGTFEGEYLEEAVEDLERRVEVERLLEELKGKLRLGVG